MSDNRSTTLLTGGKEALCWMVLHYTGEALSPKHMLYKTKDGDAQ